MPSNRRQNEILQAVQERGSCSVADLAGRLAVSTETIRRNLKSLVDKGMVVKFHGGAMLPAGRDEPPFQRRLQVNRDLKRAVAAAAVARIKDGDSIILDNGTTTSYVADALAGHARLVVITNSADIACRLASRNGNRVFLAGGEINPEDLAAFGPSVIAFLRQFQARYALLSVGGINERGDFADFHLWEAEFARAAMEQAEEAWVIADHTKLGREAPVKAGDLGRIAAIVTDRHPPSPFAERCAARGVKVLLPPG
jgi:DeoR family glycerol-3-phosphate regulon repressor